MKIKIKALINIGLWLLSGIIIVIFCVQFLSPYDWVIIRGNSLNANIGIMQNQDIYKQNDTIAFQWKGNDPNMQAKLKHDLLLIKHIACTEKQHLLVTTTEVYCEKALIGKVRNKDMQNKDLKIAMFNGIIPDNHYFVMGDSPNSYDSRYFGLIKKEWIMGKVWGWGDTI